MERLLVLKNGVPYSALGAAGAANSLTTRGEINDLREGSIVAFEKNGTRVTAAGSFTKTDDKFQFALGLPAGHAPRVGVLVDTKTLSYTKNLYKAAAAAKVVMGGDGLGTLNSGDLTAEMVGAELVAGVSSTGANFSGLLVVKSTGLPIGTGQTVAGETYIVVAAGTPTAWGDATFTSSAASNVLVVGDKVVGASYGVTIVDLEKETWERNKEEVSLTLTSASTTTAQMLANIVAAFNAHPKASLIATASVATGDAGIIFTGVNAGDDFTVLPQGLFFGTPVAKDGEGLSVVSVKGEGTNAQILNAEAKANAIEGKTSTQQADARGEIWTVPSLVETGVNYTVYVLTWTDQREVAYRSNNGAAHHKTLNIAVPEGDATAITAMDNLLADLTA